MAAAAAAAAAVAAAAAAGRLTLRWMVTPAAPTLGKPRTAFTFGWPLPSSACCLPNWGFHTRTALLVLLRCLTAAMWNEDVVMRWRAWRCRDCPGDTLMN
jgi:hypothetical protein